MSLQRFEKTYKPFQYSWSSELTVQHEKLHWGEWEAELQDDVKQWKSDALTAAEKNQLLQILRLFTQADVQVASNYCDYFIPYFQNHEIRQMLSSFAAREGTHQRAYALLNDTLGMDEAEYASFLANEQMLKKMEFMAQSHELVDVFSSASMPEKRMACLLAQAVCNEGMSLFSAFAMLLNYQRFGKMKGMCTIVEWSLRDETIHLEGLTKLFKEFCKENKQVVDNELKHYIYELYKEAVDIEDQIIDLSFGLGDIQGLTKDEMKAYIRYIANRRLIGLGLKGIWDNKTNPLPWLDWIVTGDSFKNFFEGKVTDYASGSLVGDWGWSF